MHYVVLQKRIFRDTQSIFTILFNLFFQLHFKKGLFLYSDNKGSEIKFTRTLVQVSSLKQ